VAARGDDVTAPTADRDLLERVDAELGDRRADWAVDRTTVGERLVAVELAGGGERLMGVAHCPAEDLATAPPDDAAGLSRWAFDPPNDDPVAAALGVAALNARSAGAIPWQVGDPMAALDADVDRIATVGLFRAAFRKFDDVEVRVIEREPVGAIEAPPGVSVAVFGPEAAAAAIDGVDVLFVTGSSLLYGGTLEYLRVAADVPTVVLIGATASFRPGPAFAAGATVFAGAQITDPERVWAEIEAGQCGTDLHDIGLKKVYVTAETELEGLDFDPASGWAARD
jgi:uncharacterized protein (DUF4213/DUF364 family)